MSDLTDRHLHILRHSLGLSDSGAGREYRNYYAGPSGGPTLDACNELAHAGLLSVEPGTGGHGFFVTDAGKALAFWQPPGGDKTESAGPVEWVRQLVDRVLTPFERNCVALLCEAMRCGPYDFHRTWETAQWDWGHGCRFSVERPQWATVDTDGLTRLVLGAHDRAIRVSISPHTFRHLAVEMYPRARGTAATMQLGARHPSIEQVLEARAK